MSIMVNTTQPRISVIVADNQLGYCHMVEYGKTLADFRVDGKWLFKLGHKKLYLEVIRKYPIFPL